MKPKVGSLKDQQNGQNLARLIKKKRERRFKFLKSEMKVGTLLLIIQK